MIGFGPANDLGEGFLVVVFLYVVAYVMVWTPLSFVWCVAVGSEEPFRARFRRTRRRAWLAWPLLLIGLVAWAEAPQQRAFAVRTVHAYVEHVGATATTSWVPNTNHSCSVANLNLTESPQGAEIDAIQDSLADSGVRSWVAEDMLWAQPNPSTLIRHSLIPHSSHVSVRICT